MESSSTDRAGEHERRGFAFFSQGRFADAAAELAIVVELRPDSAAAHGNLAAALGQAGRAAQSLASFDRALALDPAFVAAYLNAANIAARVGRVGEAIARLRQAQARFPNDPGVHFTAGELYYAQGLRDEARAALARVLALDPQHVKARWLHAIGALPQAYGPGEDPAVFRLEFEAELRALAAWCDAAPSPLAPDSVAERQPFYLAFMEEGNQALRSDYGDLCARLLAAAFPADAASPIRARPAGGPVRLAVVSGFLYDQSVWTALLRGWCAHLDRAKVELHYLYTGSTCDAETAIARSHAASFTMGLGGVGEWVAALRSLEPDIILYPEIGMDATTARLAALRLAPAQAVAWGHPETSGYPTIDHFLSAEAFEPPGAEAHYRERLVRLPGIGCHYDDLVPEFVGVDWAAWGVDPLAPRLVCPGTPYKYMPQHDRLLAEIARRVPAAQLLFFVDRAPALSECIERRLAVAFANAGLDATRHVRFLPHQSRAAFFGILRDCDALLDTIGFSGFNTAMQAIECDLPIVAWEGRFMRGRLASGALRAIGMDELVATTPQRYVDLAVRLAQDATYRLQAASRLAQRKPVLFRDPAPVRAFERFLFEAAGRGG
ncbi:MAG: tetratricopeptide repeat protein [Burkholderiales bacterium]|nr:tetratricopeptide repeat protein [Burkholderiales bacterium]